MFNCATPLSHDARAAPIDSCEVAEIGGLVPTKSGAVLGKASGLRPEVSEYLGIPFAQPPTGALRFKAPVPVAASNATIDTTAFGPDCPCNRIPTSQAYIAGPAGEKILRALAQDGTTLDEDCLTLNIWTKPQSGEAKKAVLFWIYGGGFSTGNTACPLYDGAVLADENDVVVVSANYRLNIFGFSAAPGQDTNVGLLDQRLALEWTRDNIEAFGGDSNRITVFGQSAGGASTDLIAYGYPDDPIAHALIPQSGVANSVITSGRSREDVQKNWYKASQNAGCGGEEAGEATVECMRGKSWEDILTTIEPIGQTALMSGFAPFADEKVVPSDVVSRGETGRFAKLPYLTGNMDNEAAFFVVVALAYTNITAEQAYAIPTALIQPILDLITFTTFTCSAFQAAKFRADNQVPVWRYMYYGGNYSNTYLKPLGSNYHTAELPVLFGTAANVTSVPDSDVEVSMAVVMRKAWAAFAKDPANGLAEWPHAGSLLGNSMVRLAYENETGPSFTSEATDQLICPVTQSFTGLAAQLQGILTSLSAIAIGGNATPTQLAAIQKLLGK
ncbi:cholinesterase [Zopfia rhizophila CBS 207.26]|uniref:Carboxylic ester hydrolase n=1 Tax=Zopfia rhizophila CBS 207.26 TaxID=1314779 RepID=A0A6A6ELW0_9PEZI|nr:cholinesterase [Zopfia rhizophila CBS 207.26]